MLNPTYDKMPIGGYDALTIEFYTDGKPEGTYWSLNNWGMDYGTHMKEHGYVSWDSIGAYSGLQETINGPTAIMSMWLTTFTDLAGNKTVVRADCVYPENKSTHFDNEGSGTSLVVPFQWEARHWIRMLMRSWVDENSRETYVGMWFQDLTAGEAPVLAAVYNTHILDSCMRGAGQFLENFDPGTYDAVRNMKLRSIYVRGASDGAWYSLNKYSTCVWTDLGHNKGNYEFSAYGDTLEATTCGLGGNPVEGVTLESTIRTFQITQPEQPPISDADIERLLWP